MSCIPAQEINERVVMTNGNFNPGDDDPNKPPTLTIATSFRRRSNAPLTLTVAAADDGLPKPQAGAGAEPADTDRRPTAGVQRRR